MIRFFNKDIKFNLADKMLLKRWIKTIVEQNGCKLGDVNVILCNDPSILEINTQFLGHDYYTDIITFDYSEENLLNGELYISIDTVKANALEYQQEFLVELHRVIIHGFLHLIGFDDHQEDDIKEMRQAENDALALLESLS